MPPWTTLWAASADALAGLVRRPPRVAGRAVVGFDTPAGVAVAAAVPWCAAAAVVAVTARRPAGVGRGGFTLTVPDRPPVPPDGAAPDPAGGVALVFRFPVPAGSVAATLLWRGREVAAVPVRVMGEAEFRAGLTVTGGVTARVGRHTVCATAVAGRCRGLAAAATFAHPVTLAPLRTLGVTAELARADGTTRAVPIGLPAAGGPVTVAAVFPPPGRGRAVVRWRVGGEVVHEAGVRGVSAGRFAAAVRVVGAGFVADAGAGPVPVRHPPPRAAGRVGPRFTVRSARPGWAGVARYAVTLQLVGGRTAPGWAGRALVTDAPADITPGVIDLSGRDDVTGFELVIRGRPAGAVLLRPVPAAGFDAEGAFTPPPDFPWTPAADDELTDRLGRLG